MAATVPADFTPRDYQLPLLRALDNGCKRAVAVWHRRAGKDKALWCYLISRAMRRVGVYFYIFPTYTQAKKVIWDGMDKNGFAFRAHIPRAAIKKRENDTELKIPLINGSIIQLAGAETFDSLMGTNPLGLVFSEYPLQNPRCWEYLTPILAENGGWAAFIFTPRGKNHGYQIYNLATQSPDTWFASLLTVDDTGEISPEIIAEERRSGRSEEFIQQEYYCSFEGSVHGAIYASLLREVRADNHICNVPYDVNTPVYTFWDLGIGDSTAIWFVQFCGQEIHLIDYLENSGQPLAYYVKQLQDRPYVYSTHIFPHDVQQREQTSGKTRLEVLRGLGLDCEVVAKLPVEDGIENVRGILSKCWFDAAKCSSGIDALDNYRRDFDEKKNTYTNIIHDWSSHAADAFRYLAVWYRSRSDSQVIPIGAMPRPYIPDRIARGMAW